MPTHELTKNRNGTTSLRELKSGEVMHSSVGPREEATLLYIEQSKLSEKLLTSSDELILWDIGLGAATNALAALQCHRETAANTGAAAANVGAIAASARATAANTRAAASSVTRPLHILSFENDISGLRLALENAQDFPFFEGLTEAVTTLLAAGKWKDEIAGLHWQLFNGEFHDHAPGCAAPELIFFDFYSPKTVPHLWNVATFELLYRACAPRLANGLGSTLFTYSASTRVRVALLLAGFFVGYGRNTGAKNDTTVAATRLQDLERPLDARWLERLQRSHEPFPHGWSGSTRDALFAKVLAHQQFKNQG